MPHSVRQLVYFRGNVQGVGFRMTTHRIAGGYAVVGFVRNLPDGRVELLVEGSKSELTAFLTEIQQQMGHRVTDSELDTQDASGEFNRFEIRY